jgi:predicted metalloprotease with PDZ domain
VLRYVLEIPDPARPLVALSLTLGGEDLERATAPGPDRAEVELMLPVWTPGSYLIREYSRHVQELRATGGDRQPLRWRRCSKNRYAIARRAQDRELRVEWRVYAHDLSVRTADVTSEFALLNGACLFLWPVRLTSRRAEVELVLPRGWRVAGPLLPEAAAVTPAERHRLAAADLRGLVDSPCLAGELALVSFEAAGRPHRIAVAGLGGLPLPADLAGDARKIVEAATAVFGGELPYERYEFLVALAHQGRGGLEHRDCTALLFPRASLFVRRGYEDFLGLLAHEHFHAWNVTRMRPMELWEPDLERENYTELLWVAEGFTSYYDDLLCRRAGVLTRERYLQLLGESIATCLTGPGRLLHPLAQASFDAWIKLYRPDEHTRNSTQSYYTNGSLAALALDLRIRVASSGERSLDDAMRMLWRETWLAGRGYAEADVVAALSAAAGRDLRPDVDELIHSPLDLDFGELLAPFGLAVELDRPSGPWLGITFEGSSLTVATVLDGSPAADGGLLPGDELIAAGELRLTGEWKDLLRAACEGRDTIALTVARRGLMRRLDLRPSREPIGKVKLAPIPNPTPQQARLLKDWIGDP